ncbi:hypothetical protein ACTOVN_06495 [Arcanobacterium canis]
MERQLANFVKAIAQGIFSATMTVAMQDLEECQDQLTAAIQVENIKATLYKDETSIGAFFKKYADAKLDDADTHVMLLDYFVDKIYVGDRTLTVASWFHDRGEHIT